MQNMTISMTPYTQAGNFVCSQYDVGRQCQIQLVDDNGEYTIPTGATVTIQATKPSGFGFSVACTFSGSTVTFTTTETMTNEFGRFPAEIRVTSGDTVLGTTNFFFKVERSPHPEGTTDGDAETIIPQLTLLIERVETAASSVLDMEVVAETLAAGSSATYSYDEETNTATFGIPQGEAGGGTAGVVASAYSASSTYAVGDYVMHDALLYKCTTAITTAEAWTAGHWTQVVLGDDVTDLKNDLNLKHINLFNPDTITAGKYLDGNGNLMNGADFFASDFINVSGYDSITLSRTHIAHWYDSTKANISTVDGMNTVNADATVTVPDNAVYIRFSSYNTYLSTVQVGRFVSRNNFIAYDYYRLPSFIPENDGMEQKLDLLNYESNGNLYNSQNIIYKYYINPVNGQITYVNSNDFAYSPTYVAVTEGETICANQRMMIAYYDNNLNQLSAMQMDTTRKTVIPSGAKYARFSCSAADHLSVIVNRGTSLDTSIVGYSFKLKGLDATEDSIVVDVNGNGDYTSFTEAVYMNVDNKKPIIVKPGTYDIKAEYIAKFGQTVVDNLADSTNGINNFQYGIRIHDRKVTFESGAHLVCDWTGKTVDTTHRFCAFRIEPNAELTGLDLECTNTFYCIHDDFSTSDDSPFTVTYKNCRVIGHNLFNANCIGGGCHKYSRHIIDNCYFKNNVDSTDLVLSADVRYHNTNTADAEPEVYVSNCYFSNNMNVTYYGTQTTKMRAYVNNCYAPKGINKRGESSTMTTDNVELFAWNNQTS